MPARAQLADTLAVSARLARKAARLRLVNPDAVGMFDIIKDFVFAEERVAQGLFVDLEEQYKDHCDACKGIFSFLDKFYRNKFALHLNESEFERLKALRHYAGITEARHPN